jgi:hypothetical protein
LSPFQTANGTSGFARRFAILANRKTAGHTMPINKSLLAFREEEAHITFSRRWRFWVISPASRGPPLINEYPRLVGPDQYRGSGVAGTVRDRHVDPAPPRHHRLSERAVGEIEQHRMCRGVCRSSASRMAITAIVNRYWCFRSHAGHPVVHFEPYCGPDEFG